MTRAAALAATLAAALALSACSAEPEAGQGEATQGPSAPESTPMPVEPDGGIGDGAGPPAAEQDFAQTMPTAMRGRWHVDELGRAPTEQDCDPFADGTRDHDRLITVREGGYSYFETGGRLVEVHRRTDNMIDTTFDTTYADTPTSARLEFTLQANGSLAVQGGGSDATDVAEYLRCPAN